MRNTKVYGYTLLHQLGVGGMAEVWYAENEIGKKAAVKVLLPKFCADEAIVARFQNEAKVMVQLDHPNIRQAYDYTTVDGRPCMVMEYLEGDDLSSRMKHGERFTGEQLKKWWNQIADALNYTHAEGIVHRDLKPSNIFVDKKGNVKLLDFGIAKIKESISMTRTGAMMGTLMYMSPEQVMDAKHIDAATDRYSIAVTFVHLLMGKVPYDTTTTNDFEIRKNIVEVPLNMSGIPAEWQNFLRPYLAKNPAERPALRAFDAAGAAPSGFVPPAVPEPPASPAPASEKTFVGDAAVASASATDEGTMAETPSAQTQSQPQPRKAWPWILAACAVVAAAVVCVVLLGGGGSHVNHVSQVDAADSAVVWTDTTTLESDTTMVLNENPVPEDCVDLGLSVYWKASNESGLYTYDRAVERFGDRLPTAEQFEELSKKCEWKWNTSKKGFDIQGPSGASIFLPAAGIRECDGVVDEVGVRGCYWLSTPSEDDIAEGISFRSSVRLRLEYECCNALSVRCVQEK
ncbi:MAG: protein kinase [Bacteroidales bacterium]|nr:protein kinase [Bacteroidales bacterium]